MKKPIIVVRRSRISGSVSMFEYDPGQRSQAIAKYKELEGEGVTDIYFAEIIKERH